MHSTRGGEDHLSDAQPEGDQPGLGALRAAVANYVARVAPQPPKLRDDGLAGLNSAISNIPDGLASGVLAGVNPVFGLYAVMAGPIAGGLFAGTRLMVITTTSAASLAAGEVLAGLPEEARTKALVLLVLLIGVIQILFGLLRLGRLMRFVSYSVMTGFLTGIAVLTVLSQLPTVTGYEPSGGNKVGQTINLLAHLNQVDLPTLALGAFALVLAILLPRTRLGNAGWPIAIALPSIIAALLSLGSVQIVQDVGQVPGGLPAPVLPSLSNASVDLVTGALAVAVIILVQGAGVSQSVPNPDGSPRSASRDFMAEGAANVASGFFRGIPVGGSLSSTALNVAAGARTRWAAIFSGVWAGIFVVAFPGLVARVAMPSLGALLIVASAGAIKPSNLASIWSVGWPSWLAAGITFVSTLVLPIQLAVGIGVVFSALLSVLNAASDISVVALVVRSDGKIEERKPPKQLPGDQITVLDVYGSLFYAGARVLERLLPSPRGADRPVVILRLRGRTTVGATLIDVLSHYAHELEDARGRLYLSGISGDAHDELVDSGKLQLAGPVRVYEAAPILGQATRQAYADAQAWLTSSSADNARGEIASGDGAEPAHDGAGS